MKSRPYFLPADQSKPQARQNQFGGTLGGPDRPQQAVLLRELRRHQRSSERPAIRHGADGRDAARRFLRVADAIYDPLTGAANGSGRTAFPGNIIPQNRLDPIVQKLIADAAAARRFRICSPITISRTGQFEFTRRKTDAKVTLNASPKLILLGASRLAELRLQEPADVRRPRRIAGVHNRRQKRATALGTPTRSPEAPTTRSGRIS